MVDSRHGTSKDYGIDGGKMISGAEKVDTMERCGREYRGDSSTAVEYPGGKAAFREYSDRSCRGYSKGEIQYIRY